MNFNYQKAYFTQALPAFENLPQDVKLAHFNLCLLVMELHQNRALEIPMTQAIVDIIEALAIKQIAEMSRASYFVGHWSPSSTLVPFKNTYGESWKVANCCDQILRKKLAPLPHNIQVHEGKFRVTFSNRDCWLWEEFSLATEENLEIFRNCKLPFGWTSLYKSADVLRQQIGDLWSDVDNVPDNDSYTEFIQTEYCRVNTNLRKKVAALVFEAKANGAKLVEEAEIKTEAFTWLLDNKFKAIDNVIYYTHTKKFCFGWSRPYGVDACVVRDLLKTGFPFDYEVK